MKRLNLVSLCGVSWVLLLAAAPPAKARYVDGMTFYAYVRASPVARVDPEGLSTLCGLLTMQCKKSGAQQWRVYGDSKRAELIVPGGSGCVTLLIPKAIFCTGSCKAIKGWVSAGNPAVKILDHEACHACAYEDDGLCAYLETWIPGDLTGYCDKHPIPSTPGW